MWTLYPDAVLNLSRQVRPYTRNMTVLYGET